MLNTHNLRLARHYGAFGDFPCGCKLCRAKRELDRSNRWNNVRVIIFFILVMLASCRICQASVVINQTDIGGYSINQWCDAIGKAENSKSHPYGIMTKYKHTTPREACANTIKHYWRDYNRLKVQTNFLSYAQSRYCPIGSDTDNGTCANWQHNVNYFLTR